MHTEKKILILGASSFVGRHLYRRLGTERALGTYYSAPIEDGIRFDALSMRLADVIGDLKAFSHAVVLLGDTQPNSCIADPARSHALNETGLFSVFDQLAECGVQPLFTSSEFVFDGAVGNYRETNETSPMLLYGKQKLAAERYLQNLGQSYAILRLAKVYGDKAGDGTLFTSWITEIKPGAAIRCASDQAFSPVFVGDVVEAIVRAVEWNLKGLFHLSGNRRFTRLTLLEILLDELQRQKGPMNVTIEPCSINDFDLPEKRPLDVSMVADKLADTVGMAFTDVELVCSRVVHEYLQASL